MAIRNLRLEGDPILRKTSREVKEITPKVRELIDDMIVREEGTQTGDEGCLSVPGKAGQVTRPNEVTVHFMDEDGEYYELDGTELLARAICHECEHLDGKLYIDRVEGKLHDVVEEEDEEA